MRAKRDGTYQPGYVDPAATLDRIEQLRATGMTLQDISDDSGLSKRHLTELVNHTPPYIQRDTADVIAGVKPRPSSRWIDATGTRRRMQALWAIGYTWSTIADWLGVTTARASHLATEGRARYVTPRMAEKVRELCARVGMEPGPRPRTPEELQARGWVTLAAWDDIDDPAAEPRQVAEAEVSDWLTLLLVLCGVVAPYDELTVRLAVAGHIEHARLSPCDLTETVRRLAAEPFSMSDAEIARHLRWPGHGRPTRHRHERKDRGGQAVCTYRVRNEIPAAVPVPSRLALAA